MKSKKVDPSLFPLPKTMHLYKQAHTHWSICNLIKFCLMFKKKCLFVLLNTHVTAGATSMVRNSFFYNVCSTGARVCFFLSEKKRKKDSVTHIPNKLETEKKLREIIR